MSRPTTPIRIDEYGDETHESWVLISASNVQSTGQWLFDSDIRHSHLVTVKVTRCTRKRDLNRDWLHDTELLLEVAMSRAQWGAFVSSFGTGVPATLEYLASEGLVPGAPHESRLAESHAEVREAADKAIAKLQESFTRFEEAFETGGKKVQREALRNLRFSIEHIPANMEFAASSLTEHVENVVTKARADIEGLMQSAIEQGQLPTTGSVLPVLPEHTEDGAE